MHKTIKRLAVRHNKVSLVQDCGEKLMTFPWIERALTTSELHTVAFIATLILAALFGIFRIADGAAWAFLGTAVGYAMGVRK